MSSVFNKNINNVSQNLLFFFPFSFQGSDGLHIPSTIIEGEELRDRPGEDLLEDSEPGHGHTGPGHAHIDPGHAHIGPGYAHRGPGHGQIDSEHAKIDPGHAKLDSGHVPLASSPQGDSSAGLYRPRRRSFEVHKYEAWRHRYN